MTVASNRVQALADKRNSPEVKFREFCTQVGKKKFQFFGIVEGKDDPKFYSSLFQAAVGDDYCLIVAEGKANVLKLMEMIRAHEKYSTLRVGYFVDKDFDANNFSNDVYVTPTYSVENFYCDRELIVKYLINECKQISSMEIGSRDRILNWIDEEIKKIELSFFENKRIEFINLLYFYVKNHSNFKPPFDKLFALEINLSQDEFVVNLKIKEDAKKFFKDRRKIISVASQDARWLEIKNNPKRYFRGKQSIKFMKILFKSLKDKGFLNSEIKSAHNMALTFSSNNVEDNLMMNLSAYVSRPSCLRRYIFNKFILN